MVMEDRYINELIDRHSPSYLWKEQWKHTVGTHTSWILTVTGGLQCVDPARELQKPCSERIMRRRESR
jgi:hypothetical protein